MAKIKVRKDVAEQMTSKLKTLKNEDIKPEFAEKLQKSALKSQNEQITSKLQANKNIGIAPDGCVYDLDNPTEKFYYDLKMQFAKANDEVKKGFKPNTPRTYVTKMVTRNGKTFPKKIPYAVNTEKKKKYITKDVVDLTEQEKNNLIKLLTKEPTVIIDGIKVHRAKLNKPNKKQFEIELEQCKVLKSKGYDVFLLRENYGNGKIADTITNGSFLELKNTPENVGDNYSKGRSQGFNVFIKVDEPMTVETAIGEIFGKLKEKVKNHSKKIEGKVCLLMDKTNKYVELDINKKGHASINSVPLVIAKSIRVVTNSTWLNSILPQLDNLSSKNVTKSLFTDWKVELHHLCDKKGLDYDSVIQKYDDKTTRHVAEELLHQDAENVIAYKAYKDLNKSLTYSGHKLQGRTKLYGMDISIENKKGSYRSGVDKDGHKWKTLMYYDYGYIRGTVGTDKDHLDCYVGPDKEAKKVYVIHQNDPITHKYDEDKCMLCFSSAVDAKAAYMKQYDRPGFYGSMTTMTIEQFKSFIFSHKGKMVHKSFDINITDITENNKQQKLEQVNKALNAIADNRPFMIKHIPADSSTNYGNLLVRITDFDRSKIEKAVHKIALSLDADISGASKGETFVYKAQEELVDKYFKEFTNRTRAIYNFVIGYFDLPDIRIVSKAGELRHKGKILYNPSTGLPIKESEWKKFVVELEKYLNRNYTGIGEKIVLSAESLGIILDRLSKTNSFEAVRKMSLSEMKAKRYDVDWIGDSIKNMKDKFGDVISRERQARIQIAIDSAAQRVTRVKDDMRNNIQQIIIDGIRDKQSKSVVAQNLFDKCASLNRDMQRIADSEVQMAATSSYIKEEVYNTPANEKVYFKRFEVMDDNTCKNCRKINGKVVLWSDVALPDEHIKDEIADIAIWEGKTGGLYPETILHPWCYSDDTEVMTNNGWKLFKDVEKNDKIMSINPETQEIDFVPFVKQVQYEYNGKMIHFPGRNFDLLVTPDHNMLYVKQNGKLEAMKAKDLIKNDFINLPRAIGKWEKTDTKTIKFGDLTISKAQYFRLWAWYLAEGNGRCRDGCYEVKLAQKEPMKIYNDLPDLQKVLHVESDSVCFFGDYARYFECMFGIYADKKFIPSFIKNSSADNIREFLDAFIMADGTHYKNAKCSSKKAYSDVRNEQVLRTSSKKMADDLCELIVKAGWLPSENINHCKGKLVHFKNGDYELNTDCYNISICHSKTRTYAPDIPGHLPRHNPIEVDYKGMVYDVELEKWHFLLVRRNGKCAWSGNCRGAWIRYYPEV